jgi:hypothetical protein
MADECAYRKACQAKPWSHSGHVPVDSGKVGFGTPWQDASPETKKPRSAAFSGWSGIPFSIRHHWFPLPVPRGQKTGKKWICFEQVFRLPDRSLCRTFPPVHGQWFMPRLSSPVTAAGP